MAYAIETKQNAVSLRKKGRSLNEIVQTLNITKSTASEWLRNIPLSPSAEKRLLLKISNGQRKSQLSRIEKTDAKVALMASNAEELISSCHVSPQTNKILCALLYWCEGNKNARNGVAFVNSDPHLVTSYLHLLRSSFVINEKRFNPTIHLHDYHDPKTQLDFWSKVTDIDRAQFTQPYIKPHTGIRKREGYQGCISVKYNSNDLARELHAIAKAYLRYPREIGEVVSRASPKR